MQDFVHLHVHTQYSILDGQASIPRLVDKAMADGMKGIAVTDHGDMFGIKEFFNYVNKKNSSTNSEIKDLKKRIAGLEKGTVECDNPETELVACKEKLETAKKKLFKPIFFCAIKKTNVYGCCRNIAVYNFTRAVSKTCKSFQSSKIKRTPDSS